MRITSGVVNVAHELISGHRDMDAALDGAPVRGEGFVPQPAEAEDLTIRKMDIEGLLLAVG